MHDYGIGLDIGISSVGWAVVALDGDENPCGILGMGSRIFDAAEHPKNGDSLAAPRRAARGARRRTRRRRHRKERIRSLIVSTGLLSADELDRLYEGQLSDVYELRKKALDEKLERAEFARILIHLSQRRGFKSNRKKATDKESGQILEAVGENKRRMDAGGYRTVGEMLCDDEYMAAHRRNRGGEYTATVTRAMVEDEAKKIFASQRGFGAAFAGEEFEQKYLSILLSQRSFDEGPGGDSPYGGSQIDRMIGKCTFEEGEQRAAKATYSFEYFSMLEKLNHLRLIKGGESLPLNEAQRRAIIELAHSKKDISYGDIRKTLALGEDYRLNMVSYHKDKSIKEDEKLKCGFMKAYHEMRGAMEKNCAGSFALLSKEQRNLIGTVLSKYKTESKIREALLAGGIEACDIDAVEGLSFSKFGHLSVKACDKLIPYLEQGMNYNAACEAAGYDFKAHTGDKKSRLLPPLPQEQNEITSPVVLRAVSQTVKVINAIIRERGCSPMFINLELAREMSKDFKERNQIKKEQDANRSRNERIMERIRSEYGKSSPTGQDLVKLKLFEEQGGVCAYSLKQMSLEKLFEPNYAEVDHIVPYSLSFDDSYKNKVLVLTEENRNKRNRLPLQYLSGERRDKFIVWVNSCVRDKRKQQLLLKERISEEDEKSFKERNLQDTKTASRFMLNYIRDNLEFAPSLKGKKKRVTAVNGAVTSHMRKRWGINKIREDGDLHHAIDALVIACTTDGMIQKVSRYSKYRECLYSQADDEVYAVDESTGEIIDRFPYPWPHFRKELEARLSHDPSRAVADLRLKFYMDEDAPKVRPLFVSRMPKRKVTGAAHKETVKSAKAIEDGFVIVKRPLTDLKLDKNGEIANYYLPQGDMKLYEALKERLKAHGGDGAKAFAEPFYKPSKDMSKAPQVKKVQLCEPTTLNVAVQNNTAVADNDSMVRIDVFRVEGDGYYLVPIYVADTLKEKLPGKACVAFKPYAEWKEMKDSDFVFSLYPNDLIKVTHKRGLKLTKVFKESTLPAIKETRSELMYYKSAGISVASIACINHDDTYEIKSLGIKTLEKLEKYTVDILGEYHPVRKEERQSFDIRRK